jgi:hypothetical protein
MYDIYIYIYMYIPLNVEIWAELPRNPPPSQEFDRGRQLRGTTGAPGLVASFLLGLPSCPQ